MRPLRQRIRGRAYLAVCRLYQRLGSVFDRAAGALGGHTYRQAEPSPSGKMGWRCNGCGHYSNAPVRPLYASCVAKLGEVDVCEPRR